MVIEQSERDLVECGLNRRNLGEDVDAVTILLDHPLNAAHLSLDTPQALVQLVLGRRVATSRRFHDGDASRYPVGVWMHGKAVSVRGSPVSRRLLRAVQRLAGACKRDCGLDQGRLARRLVGAPQALQKAKTRSRAGFREYRQGDSNPRYRRERAAS